LWDPILKKIHFKNRVGGVAQGVDPEFKPQYWKKKKQNTIIWHITVYYKAIAISLSLAIRPINRPTKLTTETLKAYL
jgi:hypothetical protein